MSEETEKYKGTHLLRNRYKKIKVIASAKRSIIYQVIDVGIDQPFALKELSGRFDSESERREAVNRVSEEIRKIRNFNHPGMPAVVDFFEEDENFYVVKPLIQGDDLKTLARKHGNKPFDENTVINITRQILSILKYLESQPDRYLPTFKPNNLMLDNEAKIWFVDYDLDRLYNPVKEEFDPLAPGFDAPETVNGEGDIRSSLYSLSMLLRFLFSGIDPRDPGRKYVNFRRVRDVNPQISPWLDQLIFKMGEHSPDDRPASVDEVIKVLEENASQEALERAALPLTDSEEIMEDEESELSAAVPGSEKSHPRRRRRRSRRSKKPEASKPKNQVPSCCIWGCLVLLVLMIAGGIFGYVKLKPIMEAGIHYQNGNDAKKSRKFTEAIEEYKKSIAIQPSYLSYYEMGDCYFELEEYEQAIEAYKNAYKKREKNKSFIDSQLKSKTARSYLYLGEKQAQNNKMDDAAKSFKEALKQDPNFYDLKKPSTALKRGKQNFKDKKYGAALYDYDWALETDSKSIEALTGRARVYHAKKEYKKAVKDLNSAFILSPSQTRMKSLGLAKQMTIDLNKQAAVLLQAGDAEKARELKKLSASLKTFLEDDKSTTTKPYGRKTPTSYKAKPAGRPTYVKTPARVVVTKTATPAKPQIDRSSQKQYYVFGGNSSSGYIVQEHKGGMMLIKGRSYLPKKQWYWGKKNGSSITIYRSRGSRTSAYTYTWKKLEKVKVEQISKRTRTYGSGSRKRSYSSGYRITISRPNGASVTIENSMMARKLKMGQTAYAEVTLSHINLFLPNENYRRYSSKISGIGGIR